MTHHLNDIHRYRNLFEEGQSLDDDIIVESISVDLQNEDQISLLKEDLGDVIFKLKSYRETSNSEEYALGVEEGLQLAADMLSRLLEAYSS